jgi:hypothetical protein
MDGLFAPYRDQQLNFASLGVDDPVRHRLDTWGVGNDAAHICLVIVQVLDELEGNVERRGND